MSKKLTQEEFINKAKEIHGDKYDYSLVEYVSSDTYVWIVCPSHGKFRVKPSAHTFSKRPKGCKACGNEAKALPESEFSERLKDKFITLTYDKDTYKTLTNPISFTCTLCGSVETIKPIELLKRKSPCKVCSHTKYLSSVEYIPRFEQVHGKGTYDYSRVVWKGYHEKVQLICPRHPDKDIWLTPNQILNGQGCKYCKGVKVTNTEEFIEEANRIHNNKYDYSLVEYKTSFDLVNIVCPIHNSFPQIPNSHLRGNGCPRCADASRGWSLTSFKERCIKNNNGLGIFYLLRCTKDDEVFYKYGITSKSVESRYRTKSSIPYDYTIEYTLEDTPEVIFELEKYIKYRDDTIVRYIPKIEFEGYTECCVSLEPKYIQNTYDNIKRDLYD